MQIEHVHYFSRRLLSRYSLYLLGLFLVVGLIIFGIFFFSGQYHEERNKATKIQEQKVELEKKRDLIEFMGVSLEAAKDPAKLQRLNELLSQLIPSSEDYFSIIAALEKLSQSTGFIITEYSIDPARTTQEKIALNITGFGDSNAFLDFLKNYTISGGRLITIDKVSFSDELQSGSEISLNFYSGKSAGQQPAAISKEDKALLTSIIDKIQIQLVPKSINTSTDYPVKSNPF